MQGEVWCSLLQIPAVRQNGLPFQGYISAQCSYSCRTLKISLQVGEFGFFQSSSDMQQLSFVQKGMKLKKTAFFAEGSICFLKLNLINKVLMLNNKYPVVLSNNQFRDCQVRMSDSFLLRLTTRRTNIIEKTGESK